MEKKVVKLPKGHFEIDHNCSTCFYANWNDKKDGKPHCDGVYGGYNRPSDRNGCFHWRG